MNFMNGLLTAKIIKSLMKDNIVNNQLKIIMITSYEVDIMKFANKDKDLDSIYTKPFSLKTFESILSNLYSENLL